MSANLSVGSTRAAILAETGRPLDLDEVTLPERLEFGQVLVEIHYSGVCASQLGEIAAVKGPDRFLPHLLGHEASATVLQTGPGVSTVDAGDLAVLHWRPGDGAAGPFPTYRWGDRALNAGAITTFNRHAIVLENRMTPIPSDFDRRLAPLFGCALTTGFGVLDNDAPVRIGESVVVLGVGGVGLAVVLAASMKSAHPVVAVDLTEVKLAGARKMGATHTINSSEVSDLAVSVRDVVGSAGADVVVDTTGQPDIIGLSSDLTSPRGTTVLVGVPPFGRRACLSTLPLHFGKTLTGSHGGGSRPEVDIPRLVRLADTGKLDMASFPITEYAFEDINRALDDLRQGGTGRYVLRMRPDHSMG